MSIDGLFDYVQEHDSASFDCVYDLMVSMRDYTDDMMIAAESGHVEAFFEASKSMRANVEEHVDNLHRVVTSFSLDMGRIANLTEYILKTNSPSAR